MSLIVAARFTTQPAAEAAARRLFERGFVAEDVSLFFVNPRGQHARHASEHLSPAAVPPPDAHLHASRHTMIGAVAGAICGVALFALVTPSLVIALCAAGVGAYLGAMIGRSVHLRDFSRQHLRTLRQDAVHHETRASGMLVAVHVTPDTQRDAALALADAGGQDVERANGRWQLGRWSDFDPTRAPTLVDGDADMTQRPA